MKQAMEWKWGMGLGILCALALGVLGLQGNSQAFQAVEIPFQNPGGARVAPASAPVSQGGAPGTQGPGFVAQAGGSGSEIPAEILEKAREMRGKQAPSGDGSGMEPLKGPQGPLPMPGTSDIGAGSGGPESDKAGSPFREKPDTFGGRELPAPAQRWASAPTEEVSAFEQYVQGKLPPGVDRKLTQFGYGIFSRPQVSPSMPVEARVPEPSYRIGPGDEIQIRVWGKIQGEYTLRVDREGKIHLPTVGDIPVAGIPYGSLKAHLDREIQKYYSGYSLSVGLGQLRGIRAFVVGNARVPGTYELTNMSTMMNALFAAQGPSKTGSMREVRLVRNGQVVARMDLYDFLLRGDKSQDKLLQDGDTVFIPYVGPLVAVAGSVKQPAIYELKGEGRLSQVLAMAGGLTATAYTHRVQVERVHQGRARMVLDTNLSDLTGDRDIPLQDGDIVLLFAINPSIVNEVRLAGHVMRPGVYAWKEGLKVSDILQRPEDLMPEAIFDFAMVRRLVLPDYHEELRSFHLGRALERDPQQDLLLQPQDTLYVFSKEEFHILPTVRVTGAVWRGGEYRMREKMTLSDLIKMAGGLRPEASATGELTRVRITQKGPVTERLIVDLGGAMRQEQGKDVTLEENDYLFVRTVPDWQLYRVVHLTGEVMHPGAYAVKKGERLSSLINRAGGFTEKAYLKGVFFARRSIQELQQKRLEETLSRLEAQMASVNLSKAAGAMSKDEAEMEALAGRRRMELLARLRQVKPTGRLVLQVAQPRALEGTPSDVELEDGDTIHVPERTEVVNVMGAVYNPSAFLYEPGKTVGHYIQLAGGPTPEADTGEIYVLKVDGRAVGPSRLSSLVTWNADAYRFQVNDFQARHLDPGDTIVVPEDLERVPFLKGLKDVTTVLYQIGVAAGVLVTLL